MRPPKGDRAKPLPSRNGRRKGTILLPRLKGGGFYAKIISFLERHLLVQGFLAMAKFCLYKVPNLDFSEV